ncbi:aminotransferase class IV family protein [uncultured Shimia sp.]|uniref:aminotransferase class IV family protein n=1 Tax=uncultured Shimia sp. TaxID=573152 RepID=UPI0026186292|nr:aminotransferase class IV family protein [uncultured Shimia sp.]
MESPFRAPIPAGTRLIETFRFCAATQSVPRLDLHLARLERSARVMGFPVDAQALQACIMALSGQIDLRCRLTLSEDGASEITTAELSSQTAAIWHVAIADQPLHSDDPWLRYKTTQRAVYDLARKELPQGVDELLFLNEHGELCEGTITNLFVTLETGARVTPHLSCGLLPGVLRQSLLETGDVQEGVIDLPMLQSAKAIHVGNSLRGLIPVRLKR